MLIRLRPLVLSDPRQQMAAAAAGEKKDEKAVEVTVTGMAGELLYGPSPEEPSLAVTMLGKKLMEGRQACVGVRFIQGAEVINPQTPVVDLSTEAAVNLSAVFMMDFEVEWGHVKLRVCPTRGHEFDVPDSWHYCSGGVRRLFELKHGYDWEGFWEDFTEDEPEESSFLEQLFKDHETCLVRYTRLDDFPGIGERIEALAGGNFWTLTLGDHDDAEWD